VVLNDSAAGVAAYLWACMAFVIYLKYQCHERQATVRLRGQQTSANDNEQQRGRVSLSSSTLCTPEISTESAIIAGNGLAPMFQVLANLEGIRQPPMRVNMRQEASSRRRLSGFDIGSSVAVRQLPIRVNIRWHPRQKERMIFGSVWATEQVGRVSLRPQDRGRNSTLLGREPLPEAKAFGQMG
jgi:hypothetical protein